jgi:DNA-binding response OmpR family regulator
MKVLFMSGYSADIISPQGVIAAGVHFLQKPVSMDSLTAKVRSLLDGPAHLGLESRPSRHSRRP